MLHSSKSQCIIQWFNSMITKGAIQSISQLSDGLQFYDIVTTINNLKKRKLLDVTQDNVVNDSNITVTYAETEAVNDESNSETNSSSTEMAVDDAPESLKETENKVSGEDVVVKSGIAEIEKRFDAVKEFIDDFFNLDSSSLIIYLDCLKAKELELATVAVMLLSAMVQSLLYSNEDQLYTTTLFDLQVPEDIKECLCLVLETSVEDGPLKRTEFHRILSRPSKSKETSPKAYENVRNIIYADERSVRDKLAEKENECSELRRQLAAEMEKSKKLQKSVKMADHDRVAAVQNMRLLQNKLSDLESSQKQISMDENRAKSELEKENNELKKKLQKIQQDATDANKKYALVKNHMKKLNQENRKLLKTCMLLKDDAGPKPCKDCYLLREKLSDVKQDRNDFERYTVKLKALVRDLESKNNNLERQIKNEIKEKKRLEFRIQREPAFLSGSMSERNAVIHRYFQQGLAKSKKANIRAQNERKAVSENIEGPNQVLSINTYILNGRETKEPCPENSVSNISTYANRSIRSGVLQTDDEGHSRLAEIQRRNALYPPHLKSSYPLELLNMTTTESKYFNQLRAPVQPYRQPVESTTEDHAEFVIDSEDSQDVQPLPIRKRKRPEMQKSSAQPMKKAMRYSSQV